MTLELTQDEVNIILQFMAQTPTGSGLFPLMMKIDAQFKQQYEEPKVD
jgi:hypothetical protein